MRREDLLPDLLPLKSVLADVTAITYCQKDFLESRDRDTIAGDTELQLLRVKLSEEVFELRGVLDRDLESDFAGDFAELTDVIAQMFPQVGLDPCVRELRCLFHGQIVAYPIPFL